MALTDAFDRPLEDLRLSVTDRCNFRCRYCMPREELGGEPFLSRHDLLSFEEIECLARQFADLGVRKIRITGGEPLLRHDLPRLIEMLAAIPGVEELTLTTNGALLAGMAQRLRDAGLSRVTVSLDALDEGVFQGITDVGYPVSSVLEGIEAAGEAGLRPVKVNMVVRRGMNAEQVIPMARHFRHSGHILRFIEFMDAGNINGWNMDAVVTGDELRGLLDSHWPLEPVAPERESEVASRYHYRDGGGEVGIITSVTHPFCPSCSRARITAQGMLYNCLFAPEGRDLRARLRDGASDAEIRCLLARIWKDRTDRYSEIRTQSGPTTAPKVEMSRMGG